ncbi:PucR family transcriptional regulator [Virgibacillus sp. W0181]|uniref:PucR family transcriptional regulator n=1 Tax=Virgibacillus sp. W0181 TaxID=3391581 RepID=UPI003F4561D1
MSISLRNSMKLGRFRECEVVAGHEGLDKIIENMTVMEVPDIVDWLKGRELILTSLYAIKDDKDAQNLLIQQLFYAGVTALAIKPFHSMEAIPDTIIKSADKLGFPVIRIPDHVSYLDILSPVMQHIFDEKVVLQENLEQVTSVLQEISLNSQGVDVFAESVSTITRNVTTIESEFSFIHTPEPQQPIVPLSKEQKDELIIIKRPIRYKRKYGKEKMSCIVAPIIVDEAYFGNITSWEVNNDHLTIDLAILEKAASLLSLEFLRLKVKYDVEQQYKNDFMRELLFNPSISEKDLVEWGAKFHISEDKNYVCMLLEENQKTPSFTEEKLLTKTEVNSILQQKWPTILVGNIRDWICIILEADNNEKLHSICEEVMNLIDDYSSQKSPVCLGVGEIDEGPEGIKRSFLQAEQTLQLTKTTKEKREIIYYEDLGVFRLLSPLLGRREIYEFYESNMDKLVREDSKQELINTLKTYFYYNESLKDTANALYIHVNTLKYRIKRIEEITGCDFKKTEEKLNLFLGFKIYELLHFNRE